MHKNAQECVYGKNQHHFREKTTTIPTHRRTPVAHGSHRRTSQPFQSTNAPTRTTARRPKPRPTQPLSAAPKPTAPRGRLRRGRPQRTRPCRLPLPERLPRLLEGGRRNEGARLGARCRRVALAAGGAAVRPEPPMSLRRERRRRACATTVADLGAQRRDHEGPRVKHGAGALPVPVIRYRLEH